MQLCAKPLRSSTKKSGIASHEEMPFLLPEGNTPNYLPAIYSQQISLQVNNLKTLTKSHF